MDAKSAKHSIQLPHIVAGCIALGLIAATGFHLAQQSDAIPRDTYAPWIGLPKGGMDASNAPTREVIRQGFEMDGTRDPIASLVSQCGGFYREQDHKLKERYIARIGAGAWGPFWKIVLDVNGDRIDVALSDGSPIPPPPPPPGHPQYDWNLIEPATHIEKSRADLERIRVLWNNEALWHAEQDSEAFQCLDGNPVFLEACIDGRYAARARNCNEPAFEATGNLWRAFNELLPEPPKSEWRDAKGNSIDPSASSH